MVPGSPRSPSVPTALAVAALGASLVACASLVGANFDDLHGVSSPETTDGAAPVAQDGGVHPRAPIAAEGGACPSGLSDCTNLCVDLTTDPGNCGACARACPGDPNGMPACIHGGCVLACSDGYATCAAGCCAIPSGGPDAGEDAAHSSPGVPCGATHCSTVNGGFCCGGSQSFSTDVCEDATSNDGCKDVMYCGSSGDCAGEACCYDDSAYDPRTSPGGQESVCAATCPTGGSYSQLCDPAAAGECPAGSSCTGVFAPAGLVTTYHYCQ